MSTLSLVSVNVERSKHLDLVLPFLESEVPDVVCVQELSERDIPAFSEICGHGVFAPTQRRVDEEGQPCTGVAIFSRHPLKRTEVRQYVDSGYAMPESGRDAHTSSDPTNNAVVIAEIQTDVLFRIATTHFTWSPRGGVTEEQRRGMQALIEILSLYDEIILTGDFNAPRGGEIFSALASRYKDNIPLEYATSIDVTLHRAGKDRPEELADKMVDGLFTTPSYAASDVRLISGVSDHSAIVACIAKSK
ncbi:MAG: endonuclease/exonuclease/phosphatase family protein [Patescibacteria group bacterium]